MFAILFENKQLLISIIQFVCLVYFLHRSYTSKLITFSVPFVCLMLDLFFSASSPVVISAVQSTLFFVLSYNLTNKYFVEDKKVSVFAAPLLVWMVGLVVTVICILPFAAAMYQLLTICLVN